MVLFYGNCQTAIIQEYLIRIRDFMDRYRIVNIPRIYEADAYFSSLNMVKLGRIGYNSLFEYSDLAVRTVYEATGNIQKTIDRLLDINFYSAEAAQNKLLESITALKDRENPAI